MISFYRAMALRRIRSMTLLCILAFIPLIVVSRESLHRILPNSDVRSLILDFMQLCPQVYLCNPDLDYQINRTVFSPSCCGSCSCDERCVQRNDCCPDLLQEIPPVPKLPPSKQCVRLKYLDDGSDYMFKIFANCTRKDDISVSADCILDYQYYNFEAGITGFVPVTDDDTGLTYKNIHCLHCNAGNPASVTYWNIATECEYDMPRPPAFIPNTGFVLADGCNVVFDEPYDPAIVSPQACSDATGECSDLYKWDKMTERYCHAYTSVFKNYRNVHCALCNGWNETDIMDEKCDIEVAEPPRHSIQGYLDIQGMVASEALQTEGGRSFDTVTDLEFADCTPASNLSLTDNQGSCVSRHCPGFAFLHGITCRPLYKEASSFPVQLNMRWYPKMTIRLNASSVQSLPKEINEILTKFKDRPYPPEFNFLTQFTYDLSVKIDELMPSSTHAMTRANLDSPVVENLELNIQIFPKHVRNVTTFIADCIDLYKTGLSKAGEFQEEYVGEDGMLKTFNQHFSVQSSIGLPEDLQQLYGVTEAVIEDDGKLRLLLVQQTTGLANLDTALVTPITLCSQVVLNASRFQREVDENGTIRVTVAGADVPLTMVVFEKEYETLLMCETDLVDTIRPQSKQNSTATEVEEDNTKNKSNDISCAICFNLCLELMVIMLYTVTRFI